MKNQKSFILIIGIFLILLISYFFLPGNVIAPVKSAVQKTARPLESFFYRISSKTANFFNSVTKISSLNKENQMLKDQILELMSENSALVEEENKNRITNQEIIANPLVSSERQLIVAEIIGRQPTSFLQSFTINQGYESGVEIGQAVVYKGILVGKIVDRTEKSAEVSLILSSRSIVQGMLEGSRTMGIVKGGLQGLYIDNIPQDIDFKKGELVITSGLGGDLPKGIIIGEIDKLITPKSEIFQTFSLISPLDFNSLEIVFVVK
jgi:rod shape-determining protein MreC